MAIKMLVRDIVKIVNNLLVGHRHSKKSAFEFH